MKRVRPTSRIRLRKFSPWMPGIKEEKQGDESATGNDVGSGECGIERSVFGFLLRFWEMLGETDREIAALRSRGFRFCGIPS